jgi:hypothetical protein
VQARPPSTGAFSAIRFSSTANERSAGWAFGRPAASASSERPSIVRQAPAALHGCAPASSRIVVVTSKFATSESTFPAGFEPPRNCEGIRIARGIRSASS